MPGIRKNQTFIVAMCSGAILLAGGMAGCRTQTSDGLVSEARQYQQKGDHKAAIIQLKNALQKNPEDAEARYLLGTIYNQTDEHRSAEKELRWALKLGMNPDTVRPDLAKSLLMLGRFQEALEETQSATANADVLVLQGNALLGLHKEREARQSFELALQQAADAPDALVGLAKIALIQKDTDTALRLSEQAVTRNPKHADAWLFRGELLRTQGKNDAAMDALNQSIALAPQNASARLVRAFLSISTENFSEAKADIQAARKHAKGGLAVVTLYAQALLDHRQGAHASALESLQQVLRVAPGHMPSVLLAGAVQLSLGSIQQAEQHLKAYLEHDSANVQARKLLASTLLKKGQPQGAISVLMPAFERSEAQGDVQLLSLAGESYMRARDFSKATAYFEKASSLAPEAALIRTSLGVSKLAQGDKDRGVAELEKAIGLGPQSPQAGITLVMTHLRLKEYDKALAAVTSLEKAHPDNPIVHNLKGAVYVGMKDIPRARAGFEKALSIQPSFFPAAANLAQLDVQENKLAAAKKRFEAIIEKDGKHAQAMAALAELARRQGKTDEATTWLERASNENPDEVGPARLLAVHYLRSGQKQKALTLARKLQVSHPNNPEVIDVLAMAYSANGDKQAALESYNKLATLQPTSAVVQHRLAQAYVAAQDETAAMAALKKALSLKPDYLEAQLLQAALHVRKGNHDDALAIARQVQKQRSKAPDGHTLEGDVLMTQNKPAQAVKAYERAFDSGKNGALVVKLHAALQRAGKEADADARLAQWLKEHPADSTARMYLANINLQQKKNKPAIEQYQALLQHSPNNVAALNNLAYLYHQEKDSRALEYAEKAYSLAPESPAVLDTLGTIMVGQGNTAKGLPLLQKATRLSPGSMDIRFHLALALVKAGEKAKARRELEQLLSSGKSFSRMDEAKALLSQLQ